MIRRGFWLVAGATLGVAGYRRATRLARTLTGGTLTGGTLTGGTPSVAEAARPRPAQVVHFTGGPGPSGAARARSATRPGAAARIAAAVSFVRDVRAGMAEYADLHRRELARNLESRHDRILSG